MLHGTGHSNIGEASSEVRSGRTDRLNDGKPPKPQSNRKQPLDSQASYESAFKLESLSKERIKHLLIEQMKIFSERYDFESDFYDKYLDIEFPTELDIFEYCRYVTSCSKMENEIPIICLVYLERFITKTGILLTVENWRRLTLISLCIGSKIWDDDSLENVHFPQVMPDVTLGEIAKLEKVFLSVIDFDLIIKGAEYAKYYFILKHFAEKFNSTLPMGPLTIEQMSDLQNNTVKAESDLRERYNVKLSLKKTM